jgi:hypothetical protein
MSMNEPLQIQLQREWLAALDNATELADGTYMPKIGDAKPMSESDWCRARVRAIDAIVAAGFLPY